MAKRGEVWRIRLEQEGEVFERPVLVISADEMGDASGFLVVVSVRRHAPVLTPLEVEWKPWGGSIRCWHIHTIDVKRLVSKEADVEPSVMAEVGDRLRKILPF